VARDWPAEVVRTQLLLSLLACPLVLAYATRARRRTFERGWWRNRLLLAAIGGSVLVQVPAFATSAGREALSLAALPASAWLLAAGAALATTVAVDVGRLLLGRT
jgi:Ca2+-transporting ATPase